MERGRGGERNKGERDRGLETYGVGLWEWVGENRDYEKEENGSNVIKTYDRVKVENRKM